MEATVTLPDALARRLQQIADEQGTSLEALVRRLVSEGIERQPEVRRQRKEVQLPLIPQSETGVILPFTGRDLDEMFAREDLAS